METPENGTFGLKFPLDQAQKGRSIMGTLDFNCKHRGAVIVKEHNTHKKNKRSTQGFPKRGAEVDEKLIIKPSVKLK